jgi:uncharacterized protein YjiS (DUF1127 family)
MNNRETNTIESFAGVLGNAAALPAETITALGGVLRRTVAGVVASFRRFGLRRDTALALSDLDEATLKDIGVMRSDIPWLAERVAQTGNDNAPKAAA